MPKLLDVFKRDKHKTDDGKKERKLSKKEKKYQASTPSDGSSYGDGTEERYSAVPKREPPPIKPKPVTKHSSYMSIQLKDSERRKPSSRSILKKLKGSGDAPENMSSLDDPILLAANTQRNEELFIPRDKRRESIHDIMMNVAPPPMPPPPLPTEKHYDDVDLGLPDIQVVARNEPIRNISLLRQTHGGFGFNLGRTEYLNSSGVLQEVVYAEPGVVHKELGHDRIIEVNGNNVESRTRAEIIKLIQASPDTLNLKVQASAMIKQLSSKKTANGHIESNREVPESSPPPELKPGDPRWLVHRDGFTACNLIDTTLPAEEDASPRCRVSITRNGQVIEVDEDALEKRNPKPQDLCEDLSSLLYLNEPSILHVLRYRYGAGLIHTAAGPTLCIVNPGTAQHTTAALYNNRVMSMIKNCSPDSMPAHLYSNIELAYKEMIASSKPQSIIYIGQSGSGKTSSFKHSLFYLAHCHTPSKMTSKTVDRVVASLTILEAFSSCQTVSNTTASRYSSLSVLAQFSNSTLHLSSLIFQVGSLERSRLSWPLPGGENSIESSFHVLGCLLRDVDEQLKRELMLDVLIAKQESPLVSHLLKMASRFQAVSLGRLNESMSFINMSSEEIKSIYQLSAAVLHLTAASAVKGATNKWQFEKPQYAQSAASLLGCNTDDLAKAIFASSSTSNSLTLSRSGMNSSMDSSLGSGVVVTGQDLLNSFITGLYQEIFNLVVLFINRSLGGSGSRHTYMMTLLDVPGVQAPSASPNCARSATLDELLYNYTSERFQQLFHNKVFTEPQDHYIQENVQVELDEVINSPQSLVNLMDKCSATQLMQMQSSMSSRTDLSLFSDLDEETGLFWLLDEQSISKTPSEQAFIGKLVQAFGSAHLGQQSEKLLSYDPSKPLQFTLHHGQGSQPVIYDVSDNWLVSCRELPPARQVSQVLSNSSKSNIQDLYSGDSSESRSVSTLRRAASIRAPGATSANKMAALKKRSLIISHKLHVDNLLESISRTQIHFVYNMTACASNTDPSTNGQSKLSMNVPEVREQVRSHEMLLAVRHYRQGFPIRMTFPEFIRRYSCLNTGEQNAPTMDQKGAVERLGTQLEMEPSRFRIGLSQIFLRESAKKYLDSERNKVREKHAVVIQKYARRHLARQLITKLKLQQDLIMCVQKNIRHYFRLRHWAWWKLFVQIKPLVNVKQTEDSLRDREQELTELRAKCSKLESERTDYRHRCTTLDDELSLLKSDYNQERIAANHAAELLEQEASQRMSLEAQLNDAREAFEESERIRRDLGRHIEQTTRQLDYSDEDDVDGSDTVSRAKFDRMMRDQDFKRKQMESELKEEIETLTEQKHRMDIQMASVASEREELSSLNKTLKKKAQRLNEEGQDMKQQFEHSQAKINELEKRQRKFDSELLHQDRNIHDEKLFKEKLQRERDELLKQKYTLSQQLEEALTDKSSLETRVRRLDHEMTDLRTSNGTDTEAMSLRSAKHELERRLAEQEEEIADMHQEMHDLEMAKLKLQMEMDKLRQRHQKESDAAEREMEEVRETTTRKIKNSEARVAELEDELHEATTARREADRRLLDERNAKLQPSHDAEKERQLKITIKRLKALLVDAQNEIQSKKETGSQKSHVRALESQLEDAQSSLTSSMKSKKALELDLTECQTQLATSTRSKTEAEDKLARMTRDKIDVENQKDDLDEEMGELLKRYQVNVSQTATSTATVRAQADQIQQLIEKNTKLQEEVENLQSRITHLEDHYSPKQELLTAEAKAREFEQKLDYEKSMRTRYEGQATKSKDKSERLDDDLAKLQSRYFDSERALKQLQSQLSRLLEDSESITKRDIEQGQQLDALNKRIEFLEAEKTQHLIDLKSANKRIESLKQALELADVTDSEDDYASDSDEDYLS